MKTDDISWEILTQRIASTEKLFPELDGAASAMIADLNRVRGLYGDARVPDRRLLGLDVENVASSLDMLASLRKADVHEDEMAQSLTDLRALIVDMQARARSLIHDKLQDVLVHTTVASLGLRNDPMPEIKIVKPIVMDKDETSASSKVSKTARPICLAFDDRELGGRIDGEFKFAKIAETDKFSHVDPNIFFLPAGRALTVNTDEVVALWPGKEGVSTEDVLTKTAYRMEPSDAPVQVHGPVFVSQVKSRKRFLHAHDGFKVSEKDLVLSSPLVEKAMMLGGAIFLFFVVNFISFMGPDDGIGSFGTTEADTTEFMNTVAAILPIVHFGSFFLLVFSLVSLMVTLKNQTEEPRSSQPSHDLPAAHNEKMRILAAQHGVEPTLIGTQPRSQTPQTADIVTTAPVGLA